MEKREQKNQNQKEGVTYRWVGELIAELLNVTPELETTISRAVAQLPSEDQKRIWLPCSIRLAQLGKKEKAVAKALQLDLGIQEVAKDEAFKIAISNSGLVAQVGEKFYAYNGSNPAIRKLMHELRH